MSRAAAVALALVLLAGAAVWAQESTIPDVPPGPATLRGRVVHPERPEAAAGVEVVLYALAPGGRAGVRRTTSGPRGDFTFERISNDPETSYLLGARYGGIPFPGGRVSFGAGETEQSIEIAVAELTDDPGRVRVIGVRSRVDRLGNRLVVHESVQLSNTGQRAYFVAEEVRASGRAGYETRLPPGARTFSMPLGIVPEGIVQAGERLAFYGPLYPGAQELTYSYVLPIGEGAVDLGRRFAQVVEEMEWLLPDSGLTVERSDLEAADPQRLEGRSYARYRLAPVASGQPLALQIRAPALEPGGGELSLQQARLFLELDDAALLMREEYHLQVASDLAAVGGPEAPLVGIPLPEGAYDLRFHPDFGLQPAAAGSGVELLGPVPAGESVLEIVYRLPREAGAVQLARSVSLHNPLLSVYVADTGLVVESDRLHRKRPVRTPERLYMHFEAFEIEPDEAVTLRLDPLPARAGLPRTLAWLLVLGVGVGGVLFLTGPLRAAPGEAAAEPEASPARQELRSVVVAIRDLDHDYETGKVSDADYASFREELRARALALLREERLEPTRAKPAAAPPAATCPACGTASRDRDRFCSQCGAPLPGEAARERGAHR